MDQNKMISVITRFAAVCAAALMFTGGLFSEGDVRLQFSGQTNAYWRLDESPGATILKDETGNFNLQTLVEVRASVDRMSADTVSRKAARGVHGVLSSYNPEFDLRQTAWQFSGWFCFEAGVPGKPDVQAIAATRHSHSKFTGWDLIVADGFLRMMVTTPEGKNFAYKYDTRIKEGVYHNFRLVWEPAGSSGSLSLFLDGRRLSTLTVTGDIGPERADYRLFCLGCQVSSGLLQVSSKWLGVLDELCFFGQSQGADTTVKKSAEPAKNIIEQLGPEMKSDTEKSSGYKWIDAASLFIGGKVFENTETPYVRLPVKAQGLVSKPVWILSQYSAGLFVCFIVDGSTTPTLSARWELTSPTIGMPNYAASAVSGLDLYCLRQGKWKWFNSTKPTAQQNEVILISALPAEKITCVLYLPLYNGVNRLEIGVARGGGIEAVNPWPDKKPIVFYGTSIVQGGSASRPGAAFTSQLERRLGYPVVNFGFSGNGRMDKEVVQLMAKINASAYGIDCLPNMLKISESEIISRTEAAGNILRAADETTPIIFVEDRTYANEGVFTNKPNTRRSGLRKGYSKLQAAGLKNLYYVEGESILGSDGEATVDGSHPNDLGMFRYT